MEDDANGRPAGDLRPPAGLRPLLDQGFDGDSLFALRSAVAAHALRAGLSDSRVHDLVSAAHELAANAVRHGAGTGRLRLWSYEGVLHCQVLDEGPGIPGPDPSAWTERHGSGLWMVRELTDELDATSGPYGTIMTVSLTLGGALPRAELRITVHDHPAATVLVLEGDLDLRTADQLSDAVAAVLTPGRTPHVILDLTDLVFVDSSGFAALITVEKHLSTTENGRLTLASPSTHLRSRLRTLGLLNHFHISP